MTLYAFYSQSSSPVLEETPPKFWDILLNRCLDLAICSFSSSTLVFNFESDFTLGQPGLTELGDKDNDASSGNGDNDSDSSHLTVLTYQLSCLRSIYSFLLELRTLDVTNHDPIHPLFLLFFLLLLLLLHILHILPNFDTFTNPHSHPPKNIETPDLTCEPLYELRLHILRKLMGLTGLDI
ncbi:hypothetical protein BYT27DRAFT_7333091 [Phlegmacium glaucopus]|nr:hypothetical protein BYT27DRAFT_7333091 [Phlegmacium glaucopus]